jgi:hypothetical protein
MKKWVAICVFVFLIVSASQVFANLDDNRASMAARYGDYRLVVDKDGHLWTKADWESGGAVKSKVGAGAYVYYFTRNGMNMQMEVQYESSKPEARVTIQRITPDSSIQIKDFKDYFPEVYSLTVDPKAQVFTTRRELTRNFQPLHSPITLGVYISGSAAKLGWGTLIAFNVQGQGQLIDNSKDINKDTYIQEFNIERLIQRPDEESGDRGRSWQTIKSPF